MTNVTTINLVKPEPAAVDPDIVEKLEMLLEFAKSGQIKGFVFVADTEFHGEPPTNYMVTNFRDNWRMLGAVEYARKAVWKFTERGTL